jgi:hypothetical protein
VFLQIIVRYLGRYESTETIAFYFFVVGLMIWGESRLGRVSDARFQAKL